MILFYLFGLVRISESTLVSVVETCRHGARAPIDYYVWDTGYWKQGLGELTQEGMRQQYLNGVEFRRRYITELNLLPSTFSQFDIHVRSTNVNRTIMSAESQLMGFYPVGPSLSSPAMQAKAVPPFNISNLNNLINDLGMQALPNYFQPIPVYTVSAAYDNMLVGYTSTSCPYINVITSMVQQSAYYQFLVSNYTNYLQKEIYKVFGELVNFEDAGWFGDVLICERFHGYDMPEGVTEEMYEQMIGIMNYSNSYFFQYNGAYLAASEFYSEILNIFEGNINGTSQLKWSFFSAHDTTLIGFLVAIDQWNGLNPPFASTIVYELHEENSNYFVQVIYNDQPLLINGCAQMCPYQEFKAFLQSWIIPDVVKACQVQNGIDSTILHQNKFLERAT